MSLTPVPDTKLLLPLGFPDAGKVFGSYRVTHGEFLDGGGQQKNQALIGHLESSASFSILWGDETGNQITDWSQLRGKVTTKTLRAGVRTLSGIGSTSLWLQSGLSQLRGWGWRWGWSYAPISQALASVPLSSCSSVFFTMSYIV